MQGVQKELTLSKLNKWSGSNKNKARNYKIQLIEEAQQEGWLPTPFQLLSFAGGPAKLERRLVDKKLTTDSHIVTIQTCGTHGGYDCDAILRQLIGVRDQHLPNMLIWPETFSSFVDHYCYPHARIPCWSSMPPRWYRNEDFEAEMAEFNGIESKPFGVMDLDICGGFTREFADQTVNLFRSGKVQDRGLLFVNHIKGRDVKKGKLLNELQSYFDSSPFSPTLQHRDPQTGELVEFSFRNETFHLDFIRYSLVPAYYVVEAFKAGYHMVVDRLVEYRDQDKDKNGVYMLQWFFSFSRRPSTELSGIVRLQTAHREEQTLYDYVTNTLIHERYSRSKWG